MEQCKLKDVCYVRSRFMVVPSAIIQFAVKTLEMRQMWDIILCMNASNYFSWDMWTFFLLNLLSVNRDSYLWELTFIRTEKITARLRRGI